MRLKFTLSGVPVELQADSKQEFRDVLEVIVSVLGGFKLPSHSASLLGAEKIPPHNASFREAETKPELKDEDRISPPETLDAPGGASPEPERSLSYKNANTVAQHVLIAIEDLGELHGTDRHYSNNEILDHMRLTGAKVFAKRKTKPIAIVGQATRESNLLVRIEDEQGDLAGYKMKEWEPKESEPESQPETELEIVPFEP